MGGVADMSPPLPLAGGGLKILNIMKLGLATK